MQVLADDADIFVLLVYFIWYYKPLAYISMRNTIVTLLTLQQQWQSWETNVQIYCQYIRSQNVTRYRIRMERGRCQSQFDVIIRFDLDLSVFANSNSEESKWMVAGIYFLLLLYGGGDGVTK